MRFYCVLITTCLSVFNLSFSQSSFSRQDFKNPPAFVKVHVWWHWTDNAITKEGITKDLESMKQQVISQATILNVSLFQQKNFGVPPIKFNSPDWFDMFRWSLKEAKRLGITLGAHSCDGWSSSGGPWITPEKSMKQFVWTKTMTAGGKSLSIQLPKPFTQKNFYRDVAVVAYRTDQTPNSFQSAKPIVKLNDTTDASYLFDGDPNSNLDVNKGNRIVITFPSEFTAEKIVIHPRRQFMWSDMASFKSNFTLSSSNDGNSFEKIKDIELTGLNQSFETTIPTTKAKYFQLVLNNHSNSDSWYGYHISEVELLKKEETAAFSPGIAHLLEKTVSIKPQSQNFFNADELSAGKSIIPEASVVDISSRLNANGLLNWQAPEGNWSIIRLGYTTTGAINAPATAEGVGLECDKMDHDALDLHFNSFSKKMVDAAGSYNGNTFKFLLVDSWECGYQNWTQKMPGEFEKRRGYSLIKFIPALCGDVVGSPAQSESFLYDYRKTIADLIEENYYKRLQQLCHQNKLEFHSEVIYGDANYPPLDILKSNSYVDLPMFEFWAGSNKQSLVEYHPSARPEANFPVYSSVLYNKPVIGSEAYTGSAHYSESPWNLKPFGDRAYSSGINQLILHSYVHQPTDQKPGLTLGGFAAHFNRNNPWWTFSSGWMDYQARIQYFLQKGETVSDILFYVGDQLPQYVENPFLKNLPFGYRANACNYDVLKNKALFQNGKITLGKNQEYRLLVLPDNEAMEYETLQRIAQLVKEGAMVYGPKPKKAFSSKNLQYKTLLETLANDVWGTSATSSGSHDYGKGKVFWGTAIEEVLSHLGLTPDISTGTSDTLNLTYIHKKTGDADIYFVSNQQNKTVERDCIFRVNKKTVEIWNPQYGSVTTTQCTADEKGMNIPVTFQPYEALIFVFTNHSGKKAAAVAPPQTVTINNFKGRIDFLPAYPEKIPSIDLSSLKSYTDFDDPAIKYFSGVAHYTIHFASPANITKSDSVMLSLGSLEATAEVRLNKKLIGNIWMPDFKMNVTGLLQPQNTLVIKVANVFRNRVIGDFKQYGSLKNVWTSTNFSYLLDKDKILKPSGVMGPLQLFIYKKAK